MLIFDDFSFAFSYFFNAYLILFLIQMFIHIFFISQTYLRGQPYAKEFAVDNYFYVFLCVGKNVLNI